MPAFHKCIVTIISRLKFNTSTFIFIFLYFAHIRKKRKCILLEYSASTHFPWLLKHPNCCAFLSCDLRGGSDLTFIPGVNYAIQTSQSDSASSYPRCWIRDKSFLQFSLKRDTKIKFSDFFI